MSKLLRTSFFAMMMVGAAALSQAQICTPDTQYTVVGLYPDSLPNGNIGSFYEQVVHVVIPQDTTAELPPFGTLEVDICQLRLDSIPNLPAGMTYICNTPDCIWIVDHTPGVINRACVTLSGTPTEAVGPDDSIVVYATVTPGAFSTLTNVCAPLGITLPDSLTTIIYKTQLRLINSNPNSIARGLAIGKLTIAPNPSSSQEAELSFRLPQADLVSVRVMNLHGQVVHQQEAGWLPAGEQAIRLSTGTLPAGLYQVQVTTQNSQLRQSSSWLRQ